jgi:hypothetical protein
MTRYVIRSMTTTDFGLGSKEPVKPYLLPPVQRCGAYWPRLAPAMTFDRPEAAYQEGVESLRQKYFDLAPVNDPDGQNFWDIQAMVAAPPFEPAHRKAATGDRNCSNVGRPLRGALYSRPSPAHEARAGLRPLGHDR